MFFETTLAAEAVDRHTASGAYPNRLLDRIFFCGGAPIPRPLAERAVERLSCRLTPGGEVQKLRPREMAAASR
jgi:hypothetical protein